MTPLKHKNIREAIVLIKKLNDNRLVVVDAKTTIRYLNIETLEVLNGFKANIKHEHYKNNVVSFSSDGNYFASISADCRESRAYSTKTKTAVAKVKRHQGEVSCIGIDRDNRYMFSCGEDGKTFAVDLKSGKLAFTLPLHADTVNDITFSRNGNWIATSSYDRKISIFNLSMMTPKQKLKGHSAPVIKSMFIKKQRLISVDKKSSAIVWNIYSGKIVSRLQGIHDDVTQMITDSEDKFLFLGTALGYILVYDLTTYELLSKSYIKRNASITALEFNEENNNLIIGTAKGDLLFYDIYEGNAHLKELLRNKEFEEIQKQADINPLLAYTKIFELVANFWENTLAKAKISLQNGDKKTAMLLFSSFKNIPAKNKIIQKVISEFADFDKFVRFAKEGKLPLAYGLANQHPMYKESKIYKSLEARWKKTFITAQRYVLDPKGMDKAKELLSPYRGLSEKTKLIQELLTQGEVYKRFRVAMGQKDFRISFELIKQHPFLMEFPEYTSLMNYADTLYVKSQEFIKQGDTHSAIKMLRILIDFDDYATEAKELMKEIENKQKFFDAVKNNDLKSAYNMLALYEDLQETDDGIELQYKWNSDLGKANIAAANGDVESIKEVLAPYMKISSKYMSLATVFGWCYMVQLENEIKKKSSRSVIENGIKNYVLSFGIQDQIESLFNIFIKHYPDSKLNLEALTKGSLSMWRPSMIVKSILD
jgi:hypothetical protein